MCGYIAQELTFCTAFFFEGMRSKHLLFDKSSELGQTFWLLSGSDLDESDEIVLIGALILIKLHSGLEKSVHCLQAVVISPVFHIFVTLC